MNERYQKLAKNSGLFMIANFGSKILTFIMVPYYTYVLTTAEYGTVDIIVATVALISPLVTFGMNDIITLFLVRKEYPKEKIFTNSFLILLIANIIILILYPFICSINELKNNSFFLFALVFVQSFYGALQSYARGIEKVVSFAISGIMYTAILVILNIIFLTVFDMGIEGYLLAMIAAYFTCCIFLLKSIDAFHLFNLKFFDKKYIKNMLHLSIPLLPTAILWWLMNICDKYTILYFMSASANGLYTVAHKLPTILATVYSVFQQAWQITSLEMKTKEERIKMYSTLFEILSCILIITTSILIMFSKFYVVVFCESTYAPAWVITPLLLISAIFNALSGFFESNYFLMKNTVAILKITIIGTVINFIMNILLVPIFGLQGAALATCIGFVYMTLHKMLGTRHFTPLHINIKRFTFSLVLIIIQSFVSILSDNSIIYYLGLFTFAILTVMYRNIISNILQKIFLAVQNKLSLHNKS